MNRSRRDVEDPFRGLRPAAPPAWLRNAIAEGDYRRASLHWIDRVYESRPLRVAAAAALTLLLLGHLALVRPSAPSVALEAESTTTETIEGVVLREPPRPTLAEQTRELAPWL